MTDPFYGEIRLMANGFNPRGWAFCSGQLLQISANTALFSLLGITYGGDGRTTFALPNLKGRVPVGQGTGPGLWPIRQGLMAGEAFVRLFDVTMPEHRHTANSRFALVPVTTTDQTGNYMSRTSGGVLAKPFYNDPPGSGQIAMSPLSLANSGGSAAHENRQPYLAVYYNIAMLGTFPSRN